MNEQTKKAFDKWWDEVGSEAPSPKDNMYEHCKKIAYMAFNEALAQTGQDPTCWITAHGEGFRIRFEKPDNDVPLGWMELYSHPTPAQQLSEETINKLAEKYIIDTAIYPAYAENFCIKQDDIVSFIREVEKAQLQSMNSIDYYCNIKKALKDKNT